MNQRHIYVTLQLLQISQNITTCLLLLICKYKLIGLPCSSDGKESACNAGDLGLIAESGRSSGEGNVNPLQYLCLENPMDRGAWQAVVHGTAKS